MPKSVYIAIWHLDTRADPGPIEATWQEKADALSEVLAVATNLFNELSVNRDNAGAIKIFTAPEYYFAMGGDYIQGYSETEKGHIVARMCAISNDDRFQDVIIVPGTIAWKVQLDRAQRDQESQNLQPFEQQKIKEYTTSFATEVAAARANIRLKHGKGKWYAFRHKVTGYVKRRWFGYNAAFAFYNGAQVGEVRKSTNAGEFNGEQDNVVMIPGTNSGIFDVPGLTGADDVAPLKIGIEICGDNGRIGQFGESGLCDIHILVAASQQFLTPYSRAGGLFVHCDSFRAAQLARVEKQDEGLYRKRLEAKKKDARIDTVPKLHVQVTTLD